MTNNIPQIRTLLEFTNSGDFYFIQVIKRRKDNPGLERDMKLIDNWFIYSLEEFDRKINKITEQCDLNNARAYIRLNIRNDKKVAFKLIALIAENIGAENYDVRNCYLSVCGKYHSDKQKKWLIDIDPEDLPQLDVIRNSILSLYVDGNPGKIYAEIPSKSGIHIICSPFNRQKFPYSKLIHKDNPTILYQNIK